MAIKEFFAHWKAIFTGKQSPRDIVLPFFEFSHLDDFQRIIGVSAADDLLLTQFCDVMHNAKIFYSDSTYVLRFKTVEDKFKFSLERM